MLEVNQSHLKGGNTNKISKREIIFFFFNLHQCVFMFFHMFCFYFLYNEACFSTILWNLYLGVEIMITKKTNLPRTMIGINRVDFSCDFFSVENK